jgi:MFS transporter
MTALYVPAAQRLIADVEPPDRLVRASLSFQALYGIGGVLGFGGAGLLYPLGGISFGLLVDAVTFAIAGAVIAYFSRSIRRPVPDQDAEENDYWRDVITGARYLRRYRPCGISSCSPSGRSRPSPRSTCSVQAWPGTCSSDRCGCWPSSRSAS